VLRRSALARRKPLARRTPISPRNAGRRARAYAEAYGERGGAVRAMRCVCWAPSLGMPWAKSCSGPIEAAHVRSRGAGGTRRDLVPLCQGHHREQHARGVVTFEKTYGVNLDAEARRIADKLDAEGLR